MRALAGCRKGGNDQGVCAFDVWVWLVGASEVDGSLRMLVKEKVEPLAFALPGGRRVCASTEKRKDVYPLQI